MGSKLEDYIDRIHYSDRYADDNFEYRHVILPKPLLREHIPNNYFLYYDKSKSPSDYKTGPLRLLTEDEWRGIGITQSLGWEHYEIHAPEPHVLLFRREKNPKPVAAQPAANGRAKVMRQK